MSKLERAVWEATNELRTNPKSIIPLIQDDLKYMDESGTIWRPGKIGLSTQEGRSAYEEAIRYAE